MCLHIKGLFTDFTLGFHGTVSSLGIRFTTLSSIPLTHHVKTVIGPFKDHTLIDAESVLDAFRYQACPDIKGSESGVEVSHCIARYHMHIKKSIFMMDVKMYKYSTLQ